MAGPSISGALELTWDLDSVLWASTLPLEPSTLKVHCVSVGDVTQFAVMIARGKQRVQPLGLGPAGHHQGLGGVGGATVITGWTLSQELYLRSENS